MSLLVRLILSLLIAMLPTVATAQTKDDPSQKTRTLSRAAAEKLFADRVLPLLVKRCFGCHGELKKLDGKLDLRSRAAMLKGGETGPAIVPGDHSKSLVYQAVLRTGDVVMPPKDRNRLTAPEVHLLRDWINAGAPWPKTVAGVSSPNTPAGSVSMSTSGGLSKAWSNRRYEAADVWAYRPVQRYDVPGPKGGETAPRHPIDAFIDRKLKQRGLTAVKRAGRRELIRRATFDLTGLPPTPEQAISFEKNDSSRALEQLIDRLLASQHYGQQQTRHWLDVVRYADTAGFSNDFERPNAWRYRDYVIRSFNADKPYDRFVVEQLAGDELDSTDPELQIAVGFLRMGPWEHTGMSVAAVTRQQYLDDVTHAVGVTFLGQGLRCARCHDHKFDPLPTRDYYRMQAVFAPVQFVDREIAYQPYENTASFAKTKPRIEKLLKEATDTNVGLKKKNRDAIDAYLKQRGVKQVADLPMAQRPPRHLGLTKSELSLQKISRKRMSYYEREMKRYRPLAFSVYSGPLRDVRSNVAMHLLPNSIAGVAQPIHILGGGSLQSPQDAVSPGVLSAMHGSNDATQSTAWNTIPDATNGRRLALARWIASPNNTLTARVIVNRIWQQHFGTGLVATPNNFGKMGSKPTHPELLDWLATWFVEHGWSIKKLHRLIMTSAAYQRSGQHADMPRVREADSRNELLAYFPPRRMAAEEVRDALLAVTGELNSEMGGAGIYPEINWEVALQPRHIMGSVAPAYQPSPTPRERNRRTIYAFRYRTLADPLLEVLNRPGADISCERRDETTVTPQAFAMLNGQFVNDRALALAARVTKDANTVDSQIGRLFRLLYGRGPTAEEMAICRKHVAGMTNHHRQHPPKRIALPTSVRREMIEELTGEPFSWDENLDLMKRYQPDIKPWDVGPDVRGLAELCLVLLNSNEFVYVR
jgi:hypothetical protein